MKNGRPLILVATALPPPTHGQSVVSLALVEALRQEECEAVIISTSPGSLKRNIAYHCSKMRTVLAAAASVVWNSGRFKPRRFYTTLESGLGILYNFLLVILARSFRYKIFIHHHTSHHLSVRRPLVAALAAVSGPTSVHITLSDAMRDDLKRLYPAIRNTRVCHNARFARPETPRERTSRGLVVVGMLSNLTMEKGLDTAIDTVIAANADGLNLTLLLAGPVVGRDAEASVEMGVAALGDKVETRGTVSGVEKSKFFSEIDVFIFPTRYRNEAQPIVLLEAMANAIPCIARDRGYVGELVGVTSMTAQSNAGFAEAALDVLRNWVDFPAEFTAAGEAAALRFHELDQTSEVQFRQLLAELSEH